MASLATECAGDQDAWWEFHDFYFEGPGRDAYTRDGAIAVAAEFGLDTDQFAQCIDDGAHLDAIYEQHTDAVSRVCRARRRCWSTGSAGRRRRKR